MEKLRVSIEKPWRGSAHTSRLVSVALLALGTLLGTQSSLWAESSLLQSSPDSSRPLNGSTGNGQRPSTTHPPQNGNGGPADSRPPIQSRPPRNGDNGPRSLPSQTAPDLRPRQPTQDGKPGRPNSGPTRPPRPIRPPSHPLPRPRAHYPPHGHRYPHYGWSPANAWRFRQFFFGDTRYTSQVHRHRLFVGGYMPRNYLANLQPIPPELMTYLPPVPLGYEVGYFDGYCLVYDPDTLIVVSVFDLYQY
jgi:hypothetical protein